MTKDLAELKERHDRVIDYNKAQATRIKELEEKQSELIMGYAQVAMDNFALGKKETLAHVLTIITKEIDICRDNKNLYPDEKLKYEEFEHRLGLILRKLTALIDNLEVKNERGL